MYPWPGCGSVTLMPRKLRSLQLTAALFVAVSLGIAPALCETAVAGNRAG